MKSETLFVIVVVISFCAPRCAAMVCQSSEFAANVQAIHNSQARNEQYRPTACRNFHRVTKTWSIEIIKRVTSNSVR